MAVAAVGKHGGTPADHCLYPLDKVRSAGRFSPRRIKIPIFSVLKSTVKLSAIPPHPSVRRTSQFVAPSVAPSVAQSVAPSVAPSVAQSVAPSATMRLPMATSHGDFQRRTVPHSHSSRRRSRQRTTASIRKQFFPLGEKTPSYLPFSGCRDECFTDSFSPRESCYESFYH